VKTHIEAVSVNHNTSAYMELMLRSLFACHPAGLPLSLTIYDNASQDDRTGLATYSAERGVPLVPSGFNTEEGNNSHGEILRRFVLTHPDCTHYLFLDADVVFLEPHTLGTMLEELERAPDAFAIGPRLSVDGRTEISMEARRANPDICDARLHPCCALVRNTPLFRRVVDLIGLSCVKYLWAEREEYLDTFKLMTRVMQTHEQRHIFSSAMVLHFFAVSYPWDTEAANQIKARMRDERLAELRSRRTPAMA
jgi:GT2 family glycosyltransferase